jgi:uncharacterized protein (TIGR02118 family)
MAAKMLVIYKTPKDPAAFDRHYFDVHVPMAKKLPGLVSYEVSRRPLMSLTGGTVPYLVGALHFADMNSLKAAFASDLGKQCADDRKLLASNDEVDILIFETADV